MDPHNNLPEFEKGITTNWGTVISNVVEQLPSVESDSEVSITNDDTDEEEVVFQRNPVIFNKIESPDLFSNCDESKNKETSDSRLLLFQRLTCKAPSRTYIDIDEDFPIFETPFRNIDDAVSKQRDDKKCEHISTVNDSSFITPTLSLQTLNSYDLDDMQSSFSESVGNLHTRPDKGCLISPSLEPEVLMNQLVNLSVDQSSEQRLNKQHLDTKHDLEFRNSGQYLLIKIL
uniref:Uncharacterized protein LOC100185948 n=1 Tax=Phallusia mammillata TaxID=59560 RepID=A0A6F9DJ27_9ASCI|nr:uncharacterized protein LOC100185948 [Phallusia mammillata]